MSFPQVSKKSAIFFHRQRIASTFAESNNKLNLPKSYLREDSGEESPTDPSVNKKMSIAEWQQSEIDPEINNPRSDAGSKE